MDPHPAPLPRAVFIDSGWGGLSVAFELLRRTPQAIELHYLGDHAWFPYGEKSAAALEQRVLLLAAWLQDQGPTALLTLACNSATSACLPALRQRLPFPVVGVVPAIKPAACADPHGEILLLATQATTESPATRDLVARYADPRRVHLVAAPRLVALAEAMLAGHPLQQETLDASLDALWQRPQVRTVVLGCTHFPFLTPHLQACAAARGRQIHWIDSAEGVAARILTLLPAPAAPSPPTRSLLRLDSTVPDKALPEVQLPVAAGNHRVGFAALPS